MKKIIEKNLGFSLVEMIVAIGIFLVAVSVVVLFFNQSLIAQRRILGSQDIQDNLRYAVEFMMREIRMGSDFSVGVGASLIPNYSEFLASDTLKFTNYKGESVTYSWDRNERSLNYHLILRNGQPFISQALEVYDAGFILRQDNQSRITIILKAKIKGGRKPEEQIPFVIQTTISPRSF